MSSLQRSLPDKRQAVPLDNPLAFFPLTANNMREHLPLILRQLLSYNLRQQQRYETLVRAIYAPNAQFQYPAAVLTGVDDIVCFWNGFLIGRAFMLNDVHSLNIQVNWDPDPQQLQAFVQLEAWQHLKPFAWIDWLTGIPSWKVWSTHLMRFEEYPADGPGALRLVLHEEVADQFVLLGLIPTGLYTIRTDPGTPLNWIRNTLRRAVGRMISVCTPIWVALLRGVRLIEPFETHRKR